MIGNAIAGFLGAGVAASTNSYESIATAVGTGSSGVITFSSIPGTFTHLQIRHNAITSVADRFFQIQFNNDTATNYSYHSLIGNGTAASAGAGATQSYGVSGLTPNSTTYPGVGVTDILDYANTTKNKTVRSLAGGDMNGAGGYVVLYSSNWRSTSAITSIKITASSGNFSSTSQFALYGIKG